MNNTKLKEISELNIKKSLSAVVDASNFETFLKVVYKHPTMSYKNLLLIWRQAPDSEHIAGREAITKIGLSVPEDAQKIALLYPTFKLEKEGKIREIDGAEQMDCYTECNIYDIEPEYSADYEVVLAYDLGKFEGYKKKVVSRKGLFNRIKVASGGFTVKAADEAKLNDAEKGYIDFDKKKFYVKQGLSEDMKDRTLIYLYVREEMADRRGEELGDLLIKLVTYCVYGYFGLIKAEDKTINVDAVTLQRHTHEEIKDFIEDLCVNVFLITSDLSRPILSFNEIAIANALLRTDKFEDMHITFWSVGQSLSDESLRQDLEMFDEKLHNTVDGYISRLNNTVKERNLLTYPDYPLDYEIDRRLFEEEDNDDDTRKSE